jgi:para-nitrobenzyl esterase
MIRYSIAILILLVTASCSTISNFNETDKDIVVKSQSGNYLGIEAKDLYVFKGIPYAEPPVGALRWRAPRDVEYLDAIIDASEFKNECVQPKDNSSIFNRNLSTGDEDCLYLNIYVPKNQNSLNKNKFPVMYWIHGGSNIWGAGSDYDFSNLAASQQVIVVTINYRLGLFGWFASPFFSETAEGLDKSYNFGHLDIIKGLEWVNQNISSFGGDKNNVTIFGESAGGSNTLTMIASPLAEGLFHKAISQSGYVSSYSAEYAESISELSSKNIFAEDIKYLTDSNEIVDYLQGLTQTEVYEKYIATAEKYVYPITPITIRDGIVIPKEGVYKALEKTDPNLVVVAGTNKDEMNYWFVYSEYFYDTSFEIRRTLKRSEANLRSWNKYRSAIWRYRGAEEPLRRMSKSNDNLYSYRLDWDEEDDGIFGDYSLFVGAAHGIDIPFIANSFDMEQIPWYIKNILFPESTAEGRDALSALMMRYWGNIAKYGDPNVFVPQKWEKFTASDNQMIILDNPQDPNFGMVTNPVMPKTLLKEIESDSALEIEERCLIGWIAVRDFNEDKKPKPPFDFCSNFSDEDLFKLRNQVEGRG